VHVARCLPDEKKRLAMQVEKLTGNDQKVAIVPPVFRL